MLGNDRRFNIIFGVTRLDLGEPTNLDFIDWLVVWTLHCLWGKWSLGNEESAKQKEIEMDSE